ncbi:hypothetical protein MHYP_G00160650 [Metynnis hypsauchen]
MQESATGVLSQGTKLDTASLCPSVGPSYRLFRQYEKSVWLNDAGAQSMKKCSETPRTTRYSRAVMTKAAVTLKAEEEEVT